MTHDRFKAAPKPIVISGPGIGNDFFKEEYYSSVLGASISTGINRHTLTEAAETGKPITKGKGKGWTVRYRNPEDQKKHRLKQYGDHKAKKELEHIGIGTISKALEEIERLTVFERLYFKAQDKIKELEAQLDECNQ